MQSGLVAIATDAVGPGAAVYGESDAAAPDAAARDVPVRKGGLAMNETMICAVGNVATQPVFRDLPNGASARFRLAVTARYWDREKSAWTDGHTNFFTVWANRQLASNASASLTVGDPVVVQGWLKVRTDVREGQNWTSADIDAVAIGHDLARGTAAFRRTGRAETAASPPQPEPNWETPAAESAAPSAEQQPEPAAVA